MPKIYFILSLCFLSLTSHSQNPTFVKYFDSLWSPISKDSAFFYTEFTRQDTLYNCVSYWVASGKLNCRSVFADTLLREPRGKFTRYFESGIVQDSVLYDLSGTTLYNYHHYPDGKLWASYQYDARTKRSKTEGFDKNGNRIDDFIFMREATFPGGSKAWMDFISQNMNATFSKKNEPPAGTYKVVVSFIVDKSGKAREVKARTDFGYKMEEKAIKIIAKSPRWIPAIYLNEPINAYRLQPVIFVISN